jgi:hypothetical protein
LRHEDACRIRIDGPSTPDTPEDEALPTLAIALIKGNAVGHILDGVAIEVDLEFVHAFRMVARRRDGTGNRMANINHEYGARLATEHYRDP